MFVYLKNNFIQLIVTLSITKNNSQQISAFSGFFIKDVFPKVKHFKGNMLKSACPTVNAG
jgi:hypothetical protein